MPRDPAAFADCLLAWWEGHGRHDLPWQHPRTPYRVWISEIMLQQTQVSTVIPYFERWMAAFSDLPALAVAPLDEVLAHWSGLGYYARARNLHRAAQICMERHDGALPAEAKALAALPGIGQSTANAIVSQSTDRPAAVLDGNVRRVLARHAGVEGWTGAGAVQKRLWAEAEARLPKRRGADYTQAVMDLGALVCKRTNPACEACPVAADCVAWIQGCTAELPSPRPKTRVGERDLHLLLLRDGRGRLLLERRPPAGIWGGLWCPPHDDSAEAVARRHGLDPSETRALPPFKHRLTHLRMTIRPALADAAAATRVESGTDRGWFETAERRALGLPRPIARLLQQYDDGEFS